MFEVLTIILMIAVFFTVAYLIYSFLGIFIHDNKKKRVIITIAITLLSLAIYLYEDNKHTIYMKEDVLYIKPKVDTSKTE